MFVCNGLTAYQYFVNNGVPDLSCQLCEEEDLEHWLTRLSETAARKKVRMKCMSKARNSQVTTRNSGKKVRTIWVLGVTV